MAAHTSAAVEIDLPAANESVSPKFASCRVRMCVALKNDSTSGSVNSAKDVAMASSTSGGGISSSKSDRCRFVEEIVSNADHADLVF